MLLDIIGVISYIFCHLKCALALFFSISWFSACPGLPPPQNEPRDFSNKPYYFWIRIWTFKFTRYFRRWAIWFLELFSAATSKGQLISNGNFSIFKSTKKPTIFSRISALASKMGQIKNGHYNNNDNYRVFNIKSAFILFDFTHFKG